LILNKLIMMTLLISINVISLISKIVLRKISKNKSLLFHLQYTIISGLNGYPIKILLVYKGELILEDFFPLTFSD